MNQPLPDRLPDLTDGRLQVPAHHRPPNVIYDEHGRPVHFTIGQPLHPTQMVIQAPVQPGLSPEMQRLIIITFLILAVVVVCTGALVGIVVLVGGTLMGIIGVVSANLPMIGLTMAGVILAAGWAATKIRPDKSK
ncbi:hypothetical protein GCM10009837_07340 [Streptomyces durmitorensis]|uniref:Integral membrane protein n=1 Tax=Streptomyces durmitorensis TaxID=319947 RepID=A0ABY4PML1_9ACTN|nr:hypothetical protein [Streptomyces durmitorensis]UQT54374.1 hypothetical protein M4V62_04325 [Streptomyces durmitorensis]